MSFLHTPGPLAVEEEFLGNHATMVVIPDKSGQFGTLVAECSHNWQEACAGERRISWKEAEANALLFANAGAMLSALVAFMPANIDLANANVPDDVVIPLDVTMGELRALAAVIANATGGAA